MRNLAHGTPERNSTGPHEDKTIYKRKICPDCSSKLDPNGLCSVCDLNPWDPNWGPEPFQEDFEDDR